MCSLKKIFWQHKKVFITFVGTFLKRVLIMCFFVLHGHIHVKLLVMQFEMWKL